MRFMGIIKKNVFKNMTDEYLKKCYVPDVYQKDIYSIDYQQLKNAGVKLITFDIDDTIAGLLTANPSRTAITLFENLKNMGFELDIMSNTWEKRAVHFANELGIVGKNLGNAEKPLTVKYKKALELYGLQEHEMAHVGNCIADDVAGGKAAGIVTCLVRRSGVAGKIFSPDEDDLIDELKKRGIWRKHHKENKNDQYYQLGKLPGYIIDAQKD